ncbi:helix-turn-helix transcriptional regulator [Tepidibacter hydrothermalis]|uniref:Helix-turn-helix transcriptional regulator n=1 Tax=Tepidibacter hydrothermalis TaxID=3036126 RepID=A0ABY8EFN9_9FIRM|nr:helix-turn-helix transcriptional regulator [Tepidibacter hydrothermalis]WFD11596.1 helix-turn-helix transcriptional regulator [Tepidibacter hydrothermalis]
MKISKKLTPYKALADMIADSFGNKCEVIIHDLSTPQSSVVYVANGCVTGRQTGQSFDHLVKQVLLSKNFKNDYNANYIFKAENGKQIKSSTSLIRDENEEVIGAFCINFEIEDLMKMKSFLNNFFKEIEPYNNDNTGIQAEPFDNVTEVIDNIIDKTIGNTDLNNLKKKDSIRMLTFMFNKGIFLTKGSVDKVAEKLGISRVTVYSYLDEIKKNSNHQ